MELSELCVKCACIRSIHLFITAAAQKKKLPHVLGFNGKLKPIKVIYLFSKHVISYIKLADAISSIKWKQI